MLNLIFTILVLSNLTFASELKHITILGTNDIHGSVEGENHPKLGRLGDFAFFSGVVNSIRKGVSEKYKKDGGVLLIDAGDQFQGTLLSNYSEGELVFSLLNQVGYDAIIPGNHDYDFGPQGWLEDKISEKNPDKNPRGALEKIVKKATFPLLSANTYLKSSLKDENGNPVSVESTSCKPTNLDSKAINWANASHPSFLKPYLIKTVAGVRVAIIGIDNERTPFLTTVENVSDLCFRSEYDTYLEVRNSLKGKADIFVLLIHSGDTTKETTVSDLIKRLTEKEILVDAVVAGHTHFVNDLSVNQVPVIQSSANGQAFGRIDLVWDEKAKAVIRNNTFKAGGVLLFESKCDFKAKTFCSQNTDKSLSFEGVQVISDEKVKNQIRLARKVLEPLAGRKMGEALNVLTRDRISESALANRLSDSLKVLSGADIAMLNSGGLRSDIQKGTVTYEDLFRVLPFGNHAVTVYPMSKSALKSLLLRSAQSCGAFGSVMQSGLHIQYKRNCDGPQVKNGMDPEATITKIVWDATGEELDLNNETQDGTNTFSVATLDFIASGGDSYTEFKGLPVVKDFGLYREAIAEEFFKSPFQWDDKLDGRWKNTN